MSTPDAPSSELDLGLSYGEALTELDEILAHLESSAVDVDVLAERVARGAALIDHCRQRLHRVRAEVETTVDTLHDTDGLAGANGDRAEEGQP